MLPEGSEAAGTGSVGTSAVDVARPESMDARRLHVVGAGHLHGRSSELRMCNAHHLFLHLAEEVRPNLTRATAGRSTQSEGLKEENWKRSGRGGVWHREARVRVCRSS